MLAQHGEPFTLSKSLEQRRVCHLVYFSPQASRTPVPPLGPGLAIHRHVSGVNHITEVGVVPLRCCAGMLKHDLADRLAEFVSVPAT